MIGIVISLRGHRGQEKSAREGGLSGAGQGQGPEDEAEIRFAPLQELKVMKIAVFSPKLTIEEYQELYVAVMQDRARVCGLELQAAFEGTSCSLRIKRIKE